MDRAFPPHHRDRFALSDFTFIDASPFMDNYNKCSYYNMLIYFQSAYLVGGGDKFASPYMVSDNPLQYHVIETCNPVSIKPNNYKRSKVINNDFNFTRNNLKVTKVTKKSNQSYLIIIINIDLQTRTYFGMIIVI